ncbi:unnamed protein product [Acanthosepion pharaonis]|uniref:Uncharacterized protein n=1 Tax=Acanthosepion pharaonis TaxID=158019 RepID=A0A812CTN5_ACAPH|nr:unnamed protein product [Sepia pharaonis]
MGVALGTLAGRLVHPTAPVLLTKSGPFGTRIRFCRRRDDDEGGREVGRLRIRESRPVPPVPSSRVGRGRERPQGLNRSLYRMELRRSNASYPEGNFGGNQLLDGSIGLSPLHPVPTIDLHVRGASDFHQSFLWLHSVDRHLSDPLPLATPESAESYSEKKLPTRG